MIDIIKADNSHVAGISKVCSDGYWATYTAIRSEAYIKRTIGEFYNHQRIQNEVTETSSDWGGYFVAIEDNEVVGAIGGGMINDTSGEVFVLYLNPNRRNEGIGSLLLNALTNSKKKRSMQLNNGCLWRKETNKAFLSTKQEDLFSKMNSSGMVI